MIWGIRTIPQRRMPSIEIPHIHHALHCRRRKSSKLKASRGRVNITKVNNTTPNRDLKQLKSHIRIDGGAKKAVCHRAVDVRQETVSYHMDVQDITGKGGSLWSRERPPWKCLLKKNYTWMMGEHIGLELKELIETDDTTDVPGE